eukprot:7641116-Pyramimonas_sp.AAC.1
MSAATMTSASMTCRVAAKATTQAKSAATLRAARPAAAFRKWVPLRSHDPVRGEEQAGREGSVSGMCESDLRD